jgi:outer membrane protein assembly factor BamB
MKGDAFSIRDPLGDHMKIVRPAYAVRTVLAVLVVIAFPAIFGGCDTQEDDPDDLGALDKDALPAELHRLPSVQNLPPVIPGAGGRVPVTEWTGPSRPRVAWSVALPFSWPVIIRAIGIDDTVYVSGGDGVGAAQDGNLLWAFRNSVSTTGYTRADDGRLWFPAMEEGYYCLNRAGQGGLLPISFRPPPDAREAPLAGMSANGRGLRVRAGDVPLEYPPTRPGPKVGPDGTVYVATEAPDIRAVSQDGKTIWKLATRCAAQTLLAGPGSRVLFSCKDLSIHYIENGVSQWVKRGDGAIDEGNVIMPSSSIVGVMDRDGTTYFVDNPASGLETHIHCLSATGDIMWTLKSPAFAASSIGFDAKGRLYLTGMKGSKSHLLCISE